MKNRSETEKHKKILHKQEMFSLKRQIVGAAWLFLIVVALLLVIFLATQINSYQKKADEKRTDDMISYAETLDNNLTQLCDITGEIFSKNSAFDGINIYPSPAEKWNNVYEILNLLHIQVKSNKGISGLALYYDLFDRVQYAANDEVSFLSIEKLKEAGKVALKSDSKVYLNFPLAIDGKVWYNVYMKKTSSAIGGDIDLSQGLPDGKEESATYGVIFEGEFYPTWSDKSVNDYSVQRTVGDKNTEEEAMINGVVISQLVPGENHIDGKMIYLHELNSDDLSVVEILPDHIWLYLNKLHIALIILIILYVFAVFRIRKFVYQELTKPLEDMTRALANIQAGVWEIQFSAPNRISEIEDVRQAVKTLLTEIEEYKIRFYEKELEKAKIQRQYLQLQLAPHFYTNCLKNAYYMLALKEYDNAEIFLQRLSVHMRYLLQKDASFVTVAKELDFVRNYVDLQKLMTSKGLSCKISADEEAMNREIPILSIQTFIENSVKYARNAKGSQLVIELSIKFRKTEEGNYLDITVKDNGQGYPGELLDVINEQSPAEKEGMGIGVINLQNRIRLFYGDRASWYFENHGGAVSELILPERVKS